MTEGTHRATRRHAGQTWWGEWRWVVISAIVTGLVWLSSSALWIIWANRGRH